VAPPSLLLFRCKATQNLIKLFVGGNLRASPSAEHGARICAGMNIPELFTFFQPRGNDNQLWKPSLMRHRTGSCFRPRRLFHIR
jgi:hypothetical protein